MPRKKFAVPSERIRFEGYQQMPITDPRVKVAYDWYLKQKAERKAFPVMWQLLISALNGELGPQVKVAVEAANTEETMEALQDLIGAFGGDDI